MSAKLLVTGVLVAFGLSGALFAVQQGERDDDESDVRVQAGDVEVEADVEGQRQQQARRQGLRETPSRQATAATHRASGLIDLEVQNRSGEDIGEINDLAISAPDGKIVYAAVSFGGFLGIGDKLFAVPWEAVELKKVGEQDDQEWVALLDVTKQTLENAKGFDKDDWPNLADPKWRAENDRVFKAGRDRENLPRR